MEGGSTSASYGAPETGGKGQGGSKKKGEEKHRHNNSNQNNTTLRLSCPRTGKREKSGVRSLCPFASLPSLLPFTLTATKNIERG